MGRIINQPIAFIVKAYGDIRKHDGSCILLGSRLAADRSEHHCCTTSSRQQRNKLQFHTVPPRNNTTSSVELAPRVSPPNPCHVARSNTRRDCQKSIPLLVRCSSGRSKSFI